MAELNEAILSGDCKQNNISNYFYKNILQLSNNEIRIIKIKKILQQR